MKKLALVGLAVLLLYFGAYALLRNTQFGSCVAYAFGSFREVSRDRSSRFLGKVYPDTARCRGGEEAVKWRTSPWVDWQRYWATAERDSRSTGLISKLGFLSPNRRGVAGALLDMEYQRIELLQFNLFDNSGTFQEYVQGRNGTAGSAIKIWPQLRLPRGHPAYAAVGGDGPQGCRGELIRFRNLSGICNDITNALMGSTDQPFARNVPFDVTFPEQFNNQFAANRHADRLGMLKPDPQVISRKLFSRKQLPNNSCSEGRGLPGYAPQANCDYQKAPVLNVLAAFWIQFMIHDWFSHLEEGHNQSELMSTGCASRRVNSAEKPLTSAEVKDLGCRPEDRIDKSYIAADKPPLTFSHAGESYLTQAHKTTLNKVTAWWDASQIYGYNDLSWKRVKRDPNDPAKLLLEPVVSSKQEGPGYLPVLQSSDYTNPQWSGQESVAFPDNWNVGLSFFHNVFAREHNLFVDAFRKQAREMPGQDSGLRNPERPHEQIKYKDVTPDELFALARLVVSAEIAKIHTIEWTTQLLYNEPLFLALNANWFGLLEKDKQPFVREALGKVIEHFKKSDADKRNTGLYSVFASGPGIFGLGSHDYESRFILFGKKTDRWDLSELEKHVNGGVNHFGSPFNFPEEFVTVYRSQPMLPHLIEVHDFSNDPNLIRYKIPMMEELRGKATEAIHRYGLADWALSMGRQRAGKLTLQNHPAFLQNLSIPRLKSATGEIDVPALDIIRDRERGVPRYNEFRRQYGLRQLTSFDDFIDPNLAKNSPEQGRQEQIVGLLREVYGQHRCDESKIITL